MGQTVMKMLEAHLTVDLSVWRPLPLLFYSGCHLLDPANRRMGCMSPLVLIVLFFCSARDVAQGLIHARQVLTPGLYVHHSRTSKAYHVGS